MNIDINPIDMNEDIKIVHTKKGTYKIKIVPSSPYAKQGKALRSEFVIK